MGRARAAVDGQRRLVAACPGVRPPVRVAASRRVGTTPGEYNPDYPIRIAFYAGPQWRMVANDHSITRVIRDAWEAAHGVMREPQK